MAQFTPLLVQALRSFNMEALLTVAVGVTVDICGAIGPELTPYADQVVAALMDVLRDASVSREVKPLVVSAFGDVAMAVQANYEPYLQMTSMLLMQASQQTAESPDMIEFINTLRTSVLEAYSGLIVGFSDGNKKELFVPHVQGVLQILSRLASDQTKDETVLQKALALLGDLANEIGEPLKPHLREPFIASLVQQGTVSQSDEVRTYAGWCSEQLNSLAAS